MNILQCKRSNIIHHIALKDNGNVNSMIYHITRFYFSTLCTKMTINKVSNMKHITQSDNQTGMQLGSFILSFVLYFFSVFLAIYSNSV